MCFEIKVQLMSVVGGQPMLMTYRFMHADWPSGYVAGGTVPKLPSPLKSVAQLMFHGPRNQVTITMCWEIAWTGLYMQQHPSVLPPHCASNGAM